MTRATHSLLPVGLMAATLMALTSSSTAQAQKMLRWKFKEGEKIQYALRDTSETFIDAGGMEFGTVVKRTLDTTWTVKSIADDGTATLTQKIDRIQFHIDNDFIGELKYDSKNPSEEAKESQIWTMVGPIFEAMLAGESEMKISPVGEVSEIKVAEELTKVFEEMEERGPNQFASMLGISMSEDDIKNELRQSVALLPGDAVADDTEWTQEHEVSQGPLGTLKMSFKYSYDGETEHEGTSYEKIDLDVQISFEIPEDSDAEVEISEQDISGSIYFDGEAGRIAYSNLKQSLVMEAFIMGNDIIQETEASNEMMLGTSDDLPESEEDEAAESDESEQ